MTLLSKLFGRGDATRSHGPGPTHAGAADVIARALSAAGLDRARGDGLRATIDRALADAGFSMPGTDRARPPARAEDARTSASPAAVGARGQFLRASYSGAHGSRDYRLYLPVGHDAAAPAPLVVMLHGCTQTPEDFAVGTGMNALADRHGFVVAYPEQVARANQARCWNWFRPQDQRADAGEPAILMGIAEQIALEHRTDPHRVFVAGLSAGAAMAVVLAHAYPGRIRAVGVHSGLPYASAHDVPSALAAMQGRAAAHAVADAASTGHVVPMIVFHGDRDRTVAPSNADGLVRLHVGAGTVTRSSGNVADGHAYTRETMMDATGRPLLERWTVHGAGHAWSGGHAAGSYTDPAGPDASSEMVRFFLDVAAAPT